MDLYIAWVAMLKGRRLTKFSTIQEKVLTRGEISALSQICMESCTRLKVTDMFPLSAPCKQLSMVKAVLLANSLATKAWNSNLRALHSLQRHQLPIAKKLFVAGDLYLLFENYSQYIYLYFLFKKIDEFKIFKEFETKIKK